MDLETILQDVLDKAHRGHRYVADREQYQRPEHWQTGLIGDCEDFALWCRNQLAVRGVSSELLWCRTETGEQHMALYAQGWVLDNRSKWVRRSQDVNYTWLGLGEPDGTWREVTA
ncbi:transglutaminase-like cysteine proteinase BTLCP [Pseudomonas linyingensis]|uniref:Transglutaminase-like cysteine proteinase BTLCP n=1 Tax=Pseudomonas linyingensis TaxID=915471 RepID=A0A1H6ZDF7_9PSED|nr:transglutaminase-like cysteine peptidase [Pseudomonas linyingensis]SEJ46885.1 transglutaminase-like cysteine proteinase BTLCP [Pseudomonas linyingensis]